MNTVYTLFSKSEVVWCLRGREEETEGERKALSISDFLQENLIYIFFAVDFLIEA